MAAMLDKLTIKANEKYLVIVLQHGGNDVTCKRSISTHTIVVRKTMTLFASFSE